MRSLKDIINDYCNDPRTIAGKDNDGKAFYKVIISNLERSGLEEKDFVNYLCDDICKFEDLSSFTSSMRALLS